MFSEHFSFFLRQKAVLNFHQGLQGGFKIFHKRHAGGRTFQRRQMPIQRILGSFHPPDMAMQKRAYMERFALDCHSGRVVRAMRERGSQRRAAAGAVKGVAAYCGEQRLKMLVNRYFNSGIKLEWECAKKHRWKATPDAIKAGHWCHICAIGNSAEKRKDTIETMKRIARQRGGRCLSDCYIRATIQDVRPG